MLRFVEVAGCFDTFSSVALDYTTKKIAKKPFRAKKLNLIHRKVDFPTANPSTRQTFVPHPDPQEEKCHHRLVL